MDQVQKIHSKGIYYGLPVFSDDVEGLTAIVTGANGMSGDHMVSCEEHYPRGMWFWLQSNIMRFGTLAARPL